MITLDASINQRTPGIFALALSMPVHGARDTEYEWSELDASDKLASVRQTIRGWIEWADSYRREPVTR